jgi:hypothetical protein
LNCFHSKKNPPQAHQKVWGPQPRSNQSLLQNSLLTEKRTGKSSTSGERYAKSSVISRLQSQIPTLRNREFFWQNREFSGIISEFYCELLMETPEAFISCTLLCPSRTRSVLVPSFAYQGERHAGEQPSWAGQGRRPSAGAHCVEVRDLNQRKLRATECYKGGYSQRLTHDGVLSRLTGRLFQ